MLFDSMLLCYLPQSPGEKNTIKNNTLNIAMFYGAEIY